MIHVALLEPQIPPNTGNIARLCAATNSPLHLIGKLGFRLDDAALRRAGIDYWHAVDVRRHLTWEDFENAWHQAGIVPERIFCLSAHVPVSYTSVSYHDGDCLLFGSETHGLSAEILKRFSAQAVTVPMPCRSVRSLNLATTAGIVLYEALRQLHNW